MIEAINPLGRTFNGISTVQAEFDVVENSRGDLEIGSNHAPRPCAANQSDLHIEAKVADVLELQVGGFEAGTAQVTSAGVLSVGQCGEREHGKAAKQRRASDAMHMARLAWRRGRSGVRSVTANGRGKRRALDASHGRSIYSPVSKGEATRQTILEQAFQFATRYGLEELTIGGLSEQLGMSKSGLFAHFKSKEALQLAVIEYAAALYLETVIRPTLKAARGEARLRALVTNWLLWERAAVNESGCFFAAAAFELKARPGAVRDRIVALQRDFIETIATVAKTGVSQGEFRADLDTEQLAHDIYGVMLATQLYGRLLADAAYERRAWTSIEALLRAARKSARAS